MLFFLYKIKVNKGKFYQKYDFCQEGPSLFSPLTHGLPGFFEYPG